MLDPPPGCLVQVGPHKLHLHCSGSGTPTVVFDAALGGSSLSWTLIQPEIAQLTHCCSYDRAGFGWSESGPLPRTAGRVASELHELLGRARVAPPYLLVGHSFGGLVMRLMAARHSDEIAGLVLIEPAIPEEWANPGETQRESIARGVRLCRYGVAAARRGYAAAVARLVSVGAIGLARSLVRLLSRGGFGRQDEQILAPIWKLPAETRKLLTQMWTQPKFFEALGSQIESITESALQVRREEQPDFGALPLVIMTAEGASETRHQADASLARRSTRSRHILVPDSGHWVPLDAPQAVIDVIRQMVQEIRGGR
jgi:pimeloyl-ACP methyl ester carboxylesterase